MTTKTMMMTAETSFHGATRTNRALTANLERHALQWMAERAPSWVSSDGLTMLGLGAQVGAGLFYALARYDRRVLLAVIACIALNWLGDSMDGTLARVRCQQRPRYGFYVDHMVDIFGTLALMGGMAASSLVHWPVALAMLIAFLVLASESYLATYTLGRFELSQGLFGPTELRLLLVAANLALLRSAYVTLHGYRVLLLDLGGSIGATGMFVLAIMVTARHTAQLFRAEPLP
jgi:archaetidylinositol phosphate synthase